MRLRRGILIDSSSDMKKSDVKVTCFDKRC
jgi:hypothetical protein